MKPLFPYYGSKTRLAQWIISMLPDHTVYCEPFAGSAAVLFAKEPSKVEVLNDHSEDLINCFRCFADPRISRALWRRLVYTPYSRADYSRANRILKDGGTEEDRAWAYYVHQGMAHAQITSSTGFRIGKSDGGDSLAAQFANKIADPTRAWAYMVSVGMGHGSMPPRKGPSGTPFGVDRTHANWSIQRGTAGLGKDAQWGRKSGVRAAAARLRNVVLECDDALKVIKRWDSPGTAFYLDPPYPGSDQGHYSGYTSEMFAELVSTLDQIQGSFLLSNYEQPGIPDHWERFEREVVLMAAKRKGAAREKRTEIVWRKLAKGAIRQQTLFDEVAL